MSRKRAALPEDIFKPDPARDQRISKVIQEMVKSPELSGLEDQEKEYVLDLICKLDQAGLLELRGLIDDRLLSVKDGN